MVVISAHELMHLLTNAFVYMTYTQSFLVELTTYYDLIETLKSLPFIMNDTGNTTDKVTAHAEFGSNSRGSCVRKR